MIMFLTVLFIGSVQPIMMVVSLIFITLFYSYTIMNIMMSFWFSYSLVMIMLSGVFVIFVYMASMAPNEEFEIYGVIFLVVFLFMMFVENKMKGSGWGILEEVSLNMWMSYMGGVIIFLGGVLFVMMLMVIWVSCKNEGALRVI